MAITNYAELQTAILDWLEDRTDLAPYVADFIAMAEGYLSHALRVRQMETTATLEVAGGMATLPGDYLEFRSVAGVSPRRSLMFITPQQAVHHPSFGAGGPFSHFSIIGDTLMAYPASSGEITLIYRQALPALSDLAPANWLLAARPELYLRAALMQAAEFIKENEDAAKHQRLTDMMIAQLHQTDMLAKYASAGTRPVAVTP